MPSDVIRIMCPKLTCRKVLAVPASARGRMVRCKSCGATLQIPIKAQAAPPPAPTDEPEKASDMTGEAAA